MAGNWLATLALLAWPLVSIGLYNSMPPSRATIWTILGGFLLLPQDAGIKLEMIPSIDKYSIPNICALIGCIVCASRPRRLIVPKLPFLLFAIYVFSPLITSVLNQDPIALAPGRFLPGVGIYDGASAVISQALFCLPFLLGWRYLRDPTDTETLIRVLAIAGLYYSLPALLEVRVSPQLSMWVYGVFPSTFATEGRYGGFRPVVFLPNGLALSFFFMTTVLAAVTLWRADVSIGRFQSKWAAAYLWAIVVVCKSAGALVYSIAAGIFVALSSPRTQARLAALLVAIALMYPLLRSENLFPTNTFIEIASIINQDRADSLRTRFDHEDLLLARASERFTFGWGRYGRNRIYTDDVGFDISLTDGQWIITMGQFGLVGFLALFGLLSIPVIRCARALHQARSERQTVFLATLAMMLALTVVEQIPNASVSPWSWLLAGALLGRTDDLRSPQHKLID
jgi:hypothetical protein